MEGREFRQRLHRGERVYGTFISVSTPMWPSIVKDTGVDFVFIGAEHVPHDRVELSQMCRMYATLGIVPIVRIPSPDPFEACKAYDGGALGVIAPYIETPEQVRALDGAAHYRPLKGARLERILTGAERAEPHLQSYLAERNADRTLIVNIESVPALEALDDILNVPGLDAVLVGPHDLTTSLGIPEAYDHPRYLEAVDTIIRKARDKGVGAGIHAVYAQALEHEVRWMRMGMNLIVHWSDIIAFRHAMRADLDALKAAVGDIEPTDDLKTINI
ncbi:MAG: HpcH/HpaI aldolase family protein [Anaerolineae bacterium]